MVVSFVSRLATAEFEFDRRGTQPSLAPWRKLPSMEGCPNEEVSLVIDDDDIAACDAHAIETDRDARGRLLCMYLLNGCCPCFRGVSSAGSA